MKLKVFAVGNSFSRNALRFLPEIVASYPGCEAVVDQAYIGGCPLEKHLRLARLHEAEPKNPEGSPYPGKEQGQMLSLKKMLLLEDWDIISIQQFSGHSFLPETFKPYAKELCEYIRRYRPKSELAVHETWAYRRDNAGTFKDGFAQEDMYRGIATSYYGIAEKLGIKRVIPVGDAFQLADETPGQTFEIDKSFDPAKAVYPQLPKQSPSLHVGYFWGEDKALHYDHGHANVRGEYLGACVWFANLFGKDARKIKFKPEGIDEADAKLLRDIAQRTAEGERPKIFPR